MNIFVRILQVLLALWHIAGGVYMSSHYQELLTERALDSFLSFFWIGLGVVQVLLSLGLLLSLAKKFRNWTPVSAVGLAIIDLFGIFVFSAYTGFPGWLWGIVPTILLAFVAYERLRRQ